MFGFQGQTEQQDVAGPPRVTAATRTPSLPQQPVSNSNVNDESTIVTRGDYRSEGNGMLWTETGDPSPAQNISHHSGADSPLPAAQFELGQSPAL